MSKQFKAVRIEIHYEDGSVNATDDHEQASAVLDLLRAAAWTLDPRRWTYTRPDSPTAEPPRPPEPSR